MKNNRFEASRLSYARQKPLFNELSFILNPGDLLLIEGPNGSGKTTLLRILAGLTPPDQGEVKWKSQSIQTSRHSFCEDFHYLGHMNGTKLDLTVVENITLMMYLSLSELTSPDFILEQLQLLNDKNTPIKYLSAGQKRRFALVKLLLLPKPLWILDEPLTGLDSSMHSHFLLLLENHLKQQGMAVIGSHHDLPITNSPVTTVKLSC